MQPSLLTDWLTGKVTVNLGGVERRLVVTYGVLLEVENETGLDCLSGVEAFFSPSMRSLRALLCAMLRRYDAGIQLWEVGALLNQPSNLPIALKAVAQALVVSMPDPEPESKPRKGQKKEAVARIVRTWADLRAAARVELGLTDEEWLAMTPREFHALRKVYVKSLRHLELVVGQVCATVKNHSMNPGKQWAQAMDYVLHRLPEDEPQAKEGPVLEIDPEERTITFQAA